MGRTIGKFALGIRTVRDDAGPISFHHAFMRHLLSVIEIWVLSGVPALVCALVSSKGKRLGDLVAGTYVVRDRFSLRLPWPVEMPPHLARWAASADIAPLPDSLALALRQLLGRTGTLSPQARHLLVTEHLDRGPAARLPTATAGHPPRGLPRGRRGRTPPPRRAPALARGRPALAADPAPVLSGSDLRRLPAHLLQRGVRCPRSRGIERHISAASRHSPPAVIQARK